MALYIGIGVAVLVVLWAIMTYNGLVSRRAMVAEGWSGIDAQLKRRADLIPNLVETVKGYAAHERQTLDSVTQARANAINAQGPHDQAQAENVLTGALRSLFAVSEAYPDLKANQNMMQLSEELTSTENKVAFSRQAYNDAVMNYNNRRETFPGSVYAGMFNFTPAALLEIPPEHPEMRDAPKVQF